jgi:hypothetical protein
MTQAPKLFRFMWRDGVFVPETRQAAYWDDQLGEGEIVTMERHEPVSQASRGHYHATIHDAWLNLPEGDERFPTEDSLRRWALIRSGWCTVSDCVCSSPEQAATVAAFTGNSEGVIVVVRENVVRKYTAKSQSAKAMNKQDFQRSKQDVLDTIAELLAVKRKQLEKNAGNAA